MTLRSALRSGTAILLAGTLLLGCGTSTGLDQGGVEGAPSGAKVPPDGPCTTGAGAIKILPEAARAFVVDDAFVYAAQADRIVRGPRSGGGGIELLAKAKAPVSLTADATSFYYFGEHPDTPDAQGNVKQGYALFTLPRSGGTPRVVADGAYGKALVSDGTALYWYESGALNRLTLSDGTISRTSFDIANVAEAAAVGRDAVFLAMYTIHPGDSAATGSIRRIPRGGGEVATIIDGLTLPAAIALDEDHIYVTDVSLTNGTTIKSARLDGTDLKTLATVQATSIAVDAHALYYSTDATIAKIDKSGGATTVVVDGLDSPAALTLHGGNVYWTNASSVALSAKAPPFGIMTACK